MLAFYIAFIEGDIRKLSAVKFVYVYCMKALAKNEGFWYTNKWGPQVEGVWGVHDNMSNYKDKYFFYLSDRLGEFRVANK